MILFIDATLLKTNIVSSEIKQIAEKLKLNSLSIYNDNDDAKVILNCQLFFLFGHFIFYLFNIDSRFITHIELYRFNNIGW